MVDETFDGGEVRRVLLWDWEGIWWDRSPSDGELCYARKYTEEELVKHAGALRPTTVMRVQGDSITVPSRYDRCDDPLKPWLDALFLRLPHVGEAYSGTVYAVTEAEWKEIAAVVWERAEEDERKQSAREKAREEKERQRLEALRNAALIVSVNRNQFDLGVRSARSLGGKYDGYRKTWTIPAGRVEVTDLSRYGLSLAETQTCWECGNQMTFLSCKANDGEWDESYCGC